MPECRLLLLEDEPCLIQTFSGRIVNPFNLTVDDIDIMDIARSLSMLCRFNGHLREFYSVAEHSVYVSYLCDPEDARWGLLHDATEAYLSDIPRPIKRSPGMAAYVEAERRAMSVIAEKFDLPLGMPDSVKRADTAMLHAEARDLMPGEQPWFDSGVAAVSRIDEPVMPARARVGFMERFVELFG